MGVRLPTVSSTAIVNVNLPNAGETVVVIAPPLNLSLALAQVLIFAYVLVSAGATATAIVCLLRRGTTTAGTQVNRTGSITVTPGGGNIWAFTYTDSPGDVAGQQYCLTMAQTGASGNATIFDVCITAMCL